jgi:hypothetical protein
MTDQISDTCTFDERTWAVESWDGNIDAIPSNEELGIETISPHTANWSGRIDHYLVVGGVLYLFKIEVTLTEAAKNTVPEGARREVAVRYEPWETTDKDGTRREIREWRFEYFIFDDLVIPFTGKLLIRGPYVDDWNLPTSAAYVDEPEAHYARLKFIKGKLVHVEQFNSEEA